MNRWNYLVLFMSCFLAQAFSQSSSSREQLAIVDCTSLKHVASIAVFAKPKSDAKIVDHIGCGAVVSLSIVPQNGWARLAGGSDAEEYLNADLLQIVENLGHDPGSVVPPRTKFAPDPVYSKEARKEKIQGTVVLFVVVGVDGLPHMVKVARGSLGYGLEEEAVKAVKLWKFEPARRNGVAVPVGINVEVNFRL